MAEGSLNGTSTLPEYATDISTLDQRSSFAIALQAASMAVIMVVALGGNLLILVAIYIDKTLQTITNVFIINLACADMLLSIIGMPFTLASSITYDWIFGDTWCKVNGMANSLFCIASILTLAAVSIDRYFAILYPFRYITWITKKVAAVMILYIWFHALLMACLPLTNWTRYTFIRSESICTVQWEYSITYTLFLFSVCFFLPLGVMMFTYLRIFRTAKRQSKQIVPVTGEIEREEPSTSEFNSCYESRTNLSYAGLPSRSTLSTKDLMNKSDISLNSDKYGDRFFPGRQTAFTVFDERNELEKEAEDLNAEDHQLSKDSGWEEANVVASNLLRPSESSAITSRGRTSSVCDSADAVSVLNSSCGSFEDSVFEVSHNRPLSYSNKGSVHVQSASAQNDTAYVNAAFTNSNKTNAYRKSGVIHLPPLKPAMRKKEIETTAQRFDAVELPAVSKTLNNNNISVNETVYHSEATCVENNSPAVDNKAKNEDSSENRLNSQSNYLSVSRNALPRGEMESANGDNKSLNIVVSRCYSQSSHLARGDQLSCYPQLQTDIRKSPVSTRKMLSTASVASLVNFSRPNSLRAFSKSSLALMKLRRRKGVQARAKMRRETKAAKTLLIVVGTFVLCWTPHFIGIFCFLIKECSWPDEFFAITTWLAMLNSACNPVIYGVMSRQFRKRFKQILQCKRGFF